MIPEQLINQFIFYPERELYANPHMLDLDYQDIWLQTDDELVIHGWFLPCKNAVASMLFLHGNAGNISHRLDNLQVLVAAGFQVLILDYRGFGRSDGFPHEAGTYLDAAAAWRWLIRETDGPHLLFGRSLGGAVALQLASLSDVRPCAVVVENTFTSGKAIAATIMPFPGLDVVLPNFYPSQERIGQIEAPLLLIHSQDDEVIPFAQGEALFESALEPKEFYSISGAHHNDAYVMGGTAYIERLRSFVHQYCAKTSSVDPNEN